MSRVVALLSPPCCSLRAAALYARGRCAGASAAAECGRGVGADAGKGDRDRERGTIGDHCWSAVRVVS